MIFLSERHFPLRGVKRHAFHGRHELVRRDVAIGPFERLDEGKPAVNPAATKKSGGPPDFS